MKIVAYEVVPINGEWVATGESWEFVDGEWYQLTEADEEFTTQVDASDMSERGLLP
jgi:hypothetical protein